MEKYNQIIDGAYKNFEEWYNEHSGKEDYTGYYVPTKEEFIRLVKIDFEFSEKWGLKIDERELSLDERKKYHPTPDIFEEIYGWNWTSDMGLGTLDDEHKKEIHLGFDKLNIPTKQITLEYNNEKIEIYE
jgi:hypothetical protein